MTTVMKRITSLPGRAFYIGELAVGIFLPSVENIIAVGTVTFFIEGDVAEHRLERPTLFHLRRHLFWVERSRAGRRLREDLHGRVGVKRILGRIDVAGLETLDGLR